MYECEICQMQIKIPSILSIAIPQIKDKGITIEYTLNQYNICRNCAHQIIGDIDALQDQTMGTSDQSS